jgi:undecaprenyl-diphosphatase
MDWRTAIGIGLFQVLSMVPGTSRSGSTIIGGLLLGCSRAVAAEFTFFLAIPVMVGASGLRLVKFFLKGNMFTGQELAILGVGCVVAFVVSMLAIRFLMNFVKEHDFKPFGWYRIALGVAVIAYFVLAG